jgi:hypothetical protein
VADLFALLGLQPRADRMARGSLFYAMQIPAHVIDDDAMDAMKSFDERAKREMLRMAGESGATMDLDTFHRHSAIAYVDPPNGGVLRPIEHSIHGRGFLNDLPADTKPDVYEVFWNMEAAQ